MLYIRARDISPEEKHLLPYSDPEAVDHTDGANGTPCHREQTAAQNNDHDDDDDAMPLTNGSH